MPKYYCDYCDTYLTHDSVSVRKTHCIGRKHKENVRDYYQKWMEDQAQRLIDQTTAAFKSGKMTGMPPRMPGMPPMPGMPGMPPMGMPGFPGMPPGMMPPGMPPGMMNPMFLRAPPPGMPPMMPGMPMPMPPGMQMPLGAPPPPPPNQTSGIAPLMSS